MTDLTGRSGESLGARAVVLHPFIKSLKKFGRDITARLDEAVGLAAAINLQIVIAENVPLPKIRAGSYFGKGTVDRLHSVIESNNIDLVCVDTALSPVQQRTLEEVWGVKVIDRTGLILEIFGERA
ncbi:MAG: GTPase HflX, partial [Pseudomonadota bacterium]|nr:GTPase HflX [Pseudomonadota bacterium]